VEFHEEGMKENDPNVYEKIIPIDLTKIKYNVPINKEKNGVFIPLTPEETY